MPIPLGMRGIAPTGGPAAAEVSRRAFVRVATVGGALAGSGAAAALFRAVPAGAEASLVASGRDLRSRYRLVEARTVIDVGTSRTEATGRPSSPSIRRDAAAAPSSS